MKIKTISKLFLLTGMMFVGATTVQSNSAQAACRVLPVVLVRNIIQFTSWGDQASAAGNYALADYNYAQASYYRGQLAQCTIN